MDGRLAKVKDGTAEYLEQAADTCPRSAILLEGVRKDLKKKVQRQREKPTQA